MSKIGNYIITKLEDGKIKDLEERGYYENNEY